MSFASPSLDRALCNIKAARALDSTTIRESNIGGEVMPISKCVQITFSSVCLILKWVSDLIDRNKNTAEKKFKKQVLNLL